MKLVGCICRMRMFSPEIRRVGNYEAKKRQENKKSKIQMHKE